MLKFDSRKLIPVIVQDVKSNEVVMLGYANKEALKLTLDTGEVWFYSRSRQELWHKGATSGSILKVRAIAKDCDSDAILIRAEPAGPVCHTGNWGCFFQKLEISDLD
jgi:phosphoribosyl-ATP pyrophosphohydrolase/phosphoribosyl-AMP cyclohydrolase